MKEQAVVSRETRPTSYRPDDRRLVDLLNSEVAILLELRAGKAAEALKGHTFWDNDQIVYWCEFIPMMAALYEVMLEIQSRYPADEVHEYEKLLPVPRNETWTGRKGGEDGART